MAALLILVAWIGVDFFWPSRANLREFDPEAVARLEAQMWRAYYARARLELWRTQVELLRTQYHLSYLRASLDAFYATRAALIFKRGKTRTDYEQALPYLEAHYADLTAMGGLHCIPREVARRELEWWIVHRERSRPDARPLAPVVAEATAALYGVPAASVGEYARLRVEAMQVRDERAEAGGPTDEEWRKIAAILAEAYQALRRALH